MRIQKALTAAGLTIAMNLAAVLAAAPTTATAPATRALATRPSATTKPATTKLAATKPATAKAATAAIAVPAATTNPALAERFSDVAQLTARTPNLTPSVWTASACLLEAAARHDAEQPRYRRLQVDALLRAGDTDRAAEALSEYRKLAPKDRAAQVQQIDFYLAKMETAEAKIRYLRDLLNASSLVAEVRSHAARLCAELMAQRGEDAIANKILDQALMLNPVNIQALQLRYRQLAEGSAAERTSGLVALVRANPAQSPVLNALTREIADAGLVQQSLKLFEAALILTSRVNQVDPPLALDYASELIIGNDARNAIAIASQIVKLQPENMGAWMVQFMAARSAGNKDLFAALDKQATVAMSNHLAIIRKAAGDAAATTRPIDTPEAVALPDPGDTIQRINGSGKKELLNDLVTLAADVAWIRIYFDGKPAEAAPWVNVLRALLPADNVTVPRLEGWALLQAGDGAGGRAKLAPLAPRDPLAAMGLVLFASRDPAQQQQSTADARKLLDENASGLTGAILSDAFRHFPLKVEPIAGSDAVKTELDKLPMEWLKIVDTPQDFYSIRLEPVRSAMMYTEPIYVEVTIQNTGEHPITVADDGVLHPDLLLDAALRGITVQQFPAVAYERMGQEFVLPPATSMSQIVRLDQGDLSRLLNENPGPSLHVTSAVLTNPMSFGQQIAPGPAGERATLIGVIQRNGSTVVTDAARLKLAETLATGGAAEKVRGVDMAATYAQRMSQQEGDDSKRIAQFCIEMVQRATTDSEASVRAWAWYMTALLSGAINRPANIDRMLRDDAWQMRTLGLAVIQQSGELRDRAKAMATSDSDELVRRYAKAVAAIPPTTQPATQPIVGAAVPSTAPVPTVPAATQPKTP